MDEYQPQILWEITRAITSVAAWYVLFYRLHRPEALWRRIVLLVAMPAAYVFWMLMPMSVLANAISWAAIPVVFAFISGDLRHSLFAAFFYIGMEASIDNTRSAMIGLVVGRFFPGYSPGYYLQYNLEYFVVLAVCYYYYRVMRKHSGKLPIISWIYIILPLMILCVILTYFTAIARPLLLEKSINIYGPCFYFGLLCILSTIGVLYLYIRQLITIDTQHLTMTVSNTMPIWTQENGLSENFCRYYKLTDREKDVIEVMMQGKTNKEIAKHLLISVRTVSTYLQNVYYKTGLTNRFALYSLIKGA